MDRSTIESPSLRELGERVRRDLGDLRGVAERERDEIVGELRRVVDKHPLASVGVAFGAGYLLSGALFSRTTARLLRLGVRLYAARLLKGTLGAGIEQAIGGQGEPSQPTGF